MASEGVVFGITGGRRFKDEEFVWDCLTNFMVQSGPLAAMVNGMAREGVDLFAYRWAQQMNIPVREFPADWDAHGEAAGPLRNQEMIDANPDMKVMVVFPGHSGTSDMTRRCRKAGIERVFFTEHPSNSTVGWG